MVQIYDKPLKDVPIEVLEKVFENANPTSQQFAQAVAEINKRQAVAQIAASHATVAASAAQELAAKAQLLTARWTIGAVLIAALAVLVTAIGIWIAAVQASPHPLIVPPEQMAPE